jgi:6-phosphogluconolactonase
MMSRAELRSYTDAESLAHGAAEQILEVAIRAIASRGRFSLALAGGSTPRATYAALAAEPFASQLEWAHTNVFWSDERCVPPDDPDSNYGMARNALLDHVPIPAANVFRIRGESEPQRAAEEYETTLQTFFSSPSEQSGLDSSADRFDLILLGLGADGHTASLFPRTSGVRETERWVTSHYVGKVDAWRVTFTPPLINRADHVFFLVSGANKARRLKDVLTGPYRPNDFPAQIVQPAKGELLWLVDGAAAALL